MFGVDARMKAVKIANCTAAYYRLGIGAAAPWFHSPMSKLFALVALCATALSANELSYKSLQSGFSGSTTPIFDHGIHGEGQIVAFLDTGVDYDSCFFVEADGSRPPI